MKIIMAEKSGFCFGVKRALDLALQATEKSENIYSYGQLIHNNQVSERLAENGLIEIESLNNLTTCDLIIRSHGVGLNVYNEADKKKINIVDCTCPFVKKVHKIVDKHYKLDYKIIIVGDKNHPEVVGINGWCNNEAIIVSDENNIVKLNKNEKYCVVAQTTLKEIVWKNVINALEVGIKEFEVFNTICSATTERQIAADNLSKKVDCMIIIGGFHSSNSKKLYEICKSNCKKTFHIEKKSDLVVTNLENCDIIGITAGASTPDWVVSDVFEYILTLSD